MLRLTLTLMYSYLGAILHAGGRKGKEGKEKRKMLAGRKEKCKWEEKKKKKKKSMFTKKSPFQSIPHSALATVTF